MAGKKSRPIDLGKLTKDANDYARKVATTVPLLPGPEVAMTEEVFGKRLHAIMEELVKAWVAGYMEGREG